MKTILKSIKLPMLLVAVLTLVSSCNKDNSTSNDNSVSGTSNVISNVGNSTIADDSILHDSKFNGYYASIDTTKIGTQLLSSLQALNSQKRKKLQGMEDYGKHTRKQIMIQIIQVN